MSSRLELLFLGTFSDCSRHKSGKWAASAIVVPGGDGALTAGDPDGFGTGEEFLRRPLDGSPGAKIKFKLAGTLQIFNPTFDECVEPHEGAPRQTVGLLR
jgi:hypothetical protein